MAAIEVAIENIEDEWWIWLSTVAKSIERKVECCYEGGGGVDGCRVLLERHGKEKGDGCTCGWILEKDWVIRF